MLQYVKHSSSTRCGRSGISTTKSLMWFVLTELCRSGSCSHNRRCGVIGKRNRPFHLSSQCCMRWMCYCHPIKIKAQVISFKFLGKDKKLYLLNYAVFGQVLLCFPKNLNKIFGAFFNRMIIYEDYNNQDREKKITQEETGSQLH